MTQHNVTAMNESDSEDGEISVGCPSPLNITNAIPEDDEKVEETKEEPEESPKPRKRSCSDDGGSKEGCDEYFKPLKKLKMMNLSKKRKEESKDRTSPNSIPLAKQYPIHKGHIPTTSRLEQEEEMASMMPMNHFLNLNLVPPAHLGIPIPIPIALRHFPSPGVLIDSRNMLLDNRNLMEHRQLLERNLFFENRHLFERNQVDNRLVDQRFLVNPTDPRHLLTAADTRHLLTPEQRNLLGIENRLFEKSLIDHRQLLEARMIETRLAEGRVGMLEGRERDSEKLDDLTNPAGQNGVKSFSILDILNHRPKAKEDGKGESGSKIVRPWDSKTAETVGKRARPKSADFCYSETLSTCSSDRSSTAGSLGGSGSDCCTSPDIINCSVSGTSGGTSRQQQRVAGKSVQGKNTSPLDALFQMTNKTFDGMNGETSGGKFLLKFVYLRHEFSAGFHPYVV
ncbi:hypothetical protein RUM43_013162 [Polyplax serrata]|uniref:Uncharacterized protein n=1 Tax=Polyplax serrata TaxID=468196 RepID=A0AAN8RSN3_POLSC